MTSSRDQPSGGATTGSPASAASGTSASIARRWWRPKRDVEEIPHQLEPGEPLVVLARRAVGLHRDRHIELAARQTTKHLRRLDVFNHQLEASTLMGMLAAGYPTEGPNQGRLEPRNVPEPQPGPGEVRVRVAVSGVNPTDWKSRRSGGSQSSDANWVIPNQDGAGRIDAVGEGVDGRRVGEPVWLYNAQWQRSTGTAAQWVALPADQAVPLPEDASFNLGASLGIPAMTAHRCLFADGELGAGTPVLIHGGAGAVGHAAIELARWRGARVATTVSSDEKAALAEAAGAELVVNYRADDVADAVRRWAPEGVRRVVEVDLGSNVELDEAVLASGGAISCYTAPAEPVTLSRALMVLNAALEFVLVYTMPEAAKQAAVADITEALREDALTTLPLHRFALSDAAAAHDAVENGAVGKVLIDIP